MAILTKAQLEALNQSSFPDQSTEAITPAILRTYNTATIDTLVDSLDTGSFANIPLTSLNAFTASQLTINSGYNTFTSSTDAKFATIGTQSGSWSGGGSTDTGSLLITASFNTSTRNITFTKGNASQFNLGGFAITGSNTFYGSQTISGSTRIGEAFGPNYIYIQSDGISLNSATQTSINFAAIQSYFQTSGNFTIQNQIGPIGSGSINILGYNGGNINLSGSQTNIAGVNFIPFSSSVNSRIKASATTGSNTFVGDQIISGTLDTTGIIASQGNLYSLGLYNNIYIAKNIELSGSQYPGNTVVVAPEDFPTDIYGGYSINNNSGQTMVGLVVNSYDGNYANTPTPMIYASADYNGSNLVMAFPTNKLDIYKPTNFKAPTTFTTGSNNQSGTATLNGGNPGTVTVSNSLVTANSIILLTRQDNNNANAGPAIISAKSAGTFTITTNHNGDTGVIGWFIINNS